MLLTRVPIINTRSENKGGSIVRIRRTTEITEAADCGGPSTSVVRLKRFLVFEPMAHLKCCAIDRCGSGSLGLIEAAAFKVASGSVTLARPDAQIAVRL